MSVFTSFTSTTTAAPLGCDSSRRSVSSHKLNLFAWAAFGFVVTMTWSPQFSALMRGFAREQMGKVQNVIPGAVTSHQDIVVSTPSVQNDEAKNGASSDTTVDEIILSQGPDQSSEVKNLISEKEHSNAEVKGHPDDVVVCASSTYWFFQADFVLAMFYLVKITLWARYVVHSSCVGANFVLFLV